jgi:hypothetical protein
MRLAVRSESARDDGEVRDVVGEQRAGFGPTGVEEFAVVEGVPLALARRADLVPPGRAG